jgi:hypothetical protein
VSKRGGGGNDSGHGGLLGGAGFLAWPVGLPAAPFYFYFCSNYFLFMFLKQKVLFCNKILHRFESLQICNICKMASGFLY